MSIKQQAKVILSVRTAKEEGEVTYPNHGAKRIAEDEEGEPEEGFHGRDMEVDYNVLKACSVDGRADVDRGCEEADLECDEEFFGGGPITRVLLVIGGPIDE